MISETNNYKSIYKNDYMVVHPSIVKDEEYMYNNIPVVTLSDFTLFKEFDYDNVRYLKTLKMIINDPKILYILSEKYEIGYYPSGISLHINNGEIVHTNFLIFTKKYSSKIKSHFARMKALWSILKLRYQTFDKVDFNPFKYKVCNSSGCLVKIFNELYSCDLDAYLLFSDEIKLMEGSEESEDVDKYNTFLFTKFKYNTFWGNPMRNKVSLKYFLMTMNIEDYIMWFQWFVSFIKGNEITLKLMEDEIDYYYIRKHINTEIEESIRNKYNGKDKWELINQFNKNREEYFKIEDHRKKTNSVIRRIIES